MELIKKDICEILGIFCTLAGVIINSYILFVSGLWFFAYLFISNRNREEKAKFKEEYRLQDEEED